MPPSNDPPVWVSLMLYALFGAGLLVWGVVSVRIGRGEEPVRYEPREPVPWGPVGAILALLSLFAASLNTLAAAIDPQGFENAVEGDPEPLAVLGDAVAALILAAIVATALRLGAGASRRDFGLPISARELLRDGALGAAAFAAALVPVYAVQAVVVWVLELPASHPTIERLLSDPDVATVISAVAMAVVVAPLFEEFAFRVLLQGWLESVAGPGRYWPTGVSSLLFALTHQGQGAAPVALFILALVLGYLYRQTHRLAPCVAMHAVFNAFSLLLVWLLGAS